MRTFHCFHFTARLRGYSKQGMFSGLPLPSGRFISRRSNEVFAWGNLEELDTRRAPVIAYLLWDSQEIQGGGRAFRRNMQGRVGQLQL